MKDCFDNLISILPRLGGSAKYIDLVVMMSFLWGFGVQCYVRTTAIGGTRHNSYPCYTTPIRSAMEYASKRTAVARLGSTTAPTYTRTQALPRGHPLNGHCASSTTRTRAVEYSIEAIRFWQNHYVMTMSAVKLVSSDLLPAGISK